MRNNPEETINTVCDFLGVRKTRAVETQDVFSIPYSSEITDEEKAYAKMVFRFDIKQLEQLLGWDCQSWL